MKFDLASLLTAIEASTPDGRWNLLQEWLKENPDWKDQVEKWATVSSDQAVIELQDFVAERFNMPALFIDRMIPPDMKLRVKSAIEKIQACYRERAGNQTEKEIKNVSSKRPKVKRINRAAS